MLEQASAILRLLDDDDEMGTVAPVKQKLEEVLGLPSLRELRKQAGGRAARHLDELIRQIGQREADAAFTQYCEDFETGGDLEKANWLLASTFAPDEDHTHQQRALDEWGERLRERLQGVVSAEDRVHLLVDFFNSEIGLRGNEADYYNMDNSILPRVIDSRRGIPITLSLLYMLVARRAGMPVDGVSLPGHFVVRHESIFFDPFHGGKKIGLEECAALLEQQNLQLTKEHLQPTSSRQMLIRMLTNIYYIGEQKNPEVAAKANRWVELLRQEIERT